MGGFGRLGRLGLGVCFRLAWDCLEYFRLLNMDDGAVRCGEEWCF